MKNLILIGFMLSLFLGVNAQEVKTNKNIIIGGSLNFFADNVDRSDSNGINIDDRKSFRINPYIGKEINPHLSLGIQLGYSTGKNKTEGGSFDSESNYNGYRVGVFSRYIINPNNRLNFYIQPYAGYNRGKTERSQNSIMTDESKSSSFDLGIGAGLFYNINDKMRATFTMGGLGYAKGKRENLESGSKTEINSFRSNFNLSSMAVGFEMKF